MKVQIFQSAAVVLAVVVILQAAPAAEPEVGLEFHARLRQRVAGATNQFEVVQKTLHWAPRKTALIICDMWNEHWCKGATARVAEMAPRMNEVIKEVRRGGVFIIHAPSST